MAVSHIRILAKARPGGLTVAQGIDYMMRQPNRVLPPGEIGEFVGGIALACQELGDLDFEPRFVQAMLETNNGRYGGQVKVSQKNIGGIGATDDGAAGMSNDTWTKAGWVFVVHGLAWADDPRGYGSPRWDKVQHRAAEVGWASTFGELGDGRWATDELYAEKLDARHADILGVVMADQYRTIDALIGVNHYPGRNGHPILGMVVHVAEGYRAGVTSWFNNPTSEASTQYLVCKNGDRLRFVRDEDTAWGNGVLDNPNRNDPFIREWDDKNINPNRRTVSVETERFKGERLTRDQQASLNELGVKLHVKHGWPNDGSRIWAHNEFDSVNRPNCPSLNQAEWGSLVTAVGGTGTVVVPPGPVPNDSSELYDKLTGKYIHPDLWQAFKAEGGVAKFGHPIAGGYLYSDGWVRQLFENVVLGARAGEVRVEGLGQAWLALTRQPAVQWPGITALV